MKLSKIIDVIGRNLSRIKTIGLLIVIILFILALVRGGCERSKIELMVERITGLNVQNDILHNDIKERDRLLLLKELRIGTLKDSLNTSEKRLEELETDYTALEGEYEDLADSLLKIPVDTSYKFLTEIAYPYPGERRYPFNEPQVKGIHLTYLENSALEEMNYVLHGQVGELKNMNTYMDSVAYEQSISLMLMSESREDLESIVSNKDEEIEIKDEQIKTAQKKKTVWQIVLGSALIVLAVFAAGGG